MKEVCYYLCTNISVLSSFCNVNARVITTIGITKPL